MRRQVFCALAAAMAAGAQAAHAQFTTDFEGLTASATGEILTGQDGYYLPAGVTSADFLAYTYAGGAYGLPANPDGGDQFIAGEGPGDGVAYARAERMAPYPTGVVKITYDVAGAYVGGATPSDNLGSFSLQPHPTPPTHQTAIFLMSWTDPAAQTWEHSYLAYDSAGAALPTPGAILGPEWTGLSLLNWYRISTTIDFDANTLVEGSITDLSTGVTTTASFTDVYLAGGAAGGLAHPTGFRFFGGSLTPGNVTAWDNLVIEQVDAGCYADCDESGGLDFFDFLCFQNAFAAGAAYADCDQSGSHDFFDFLCFQNAFAAGCP